MHEASENAFRLGPWLVEPDLNRLSRDGHATHLEPKTMAVLVYLSERPGTVISADEIIDAVWGGRPMGDNPVYKAIAKLRRALADDAGEPRFIATVPKKGYRLVGDVTAAPTMAAPSAADRSAGHRPALLIAVGIAAGVVIAGALFWQPRVPAPGIELVSSFPGSHDQPSFAPDGASIAFINDADGTPHVWVLDGGSRVPRQLTTGDAADARPRWSPAGETIAFVRGNSVWSVPAAGGEPVEIVRDAYNPNFSRDGRRIVFERRYQVWTADPDGGRQERVAGIPRRELPLTPRWPALSPDGSMIAYFDSGDTPQGDLWVIPAPGGAPRRLTSAPAQGGAPVWSPDGESLFYSSERGGSRTLWRVNVAAGTSKALLVGSGDDDFPDLNGDGTRLVYANSRQQFSIMLSNPVTGEERELYNSRQVVLAPELSPDGETLVFFGAVPAGGYQIFTLPRAGGTPTMITSDPFATHALPQWSADGDRFYFFHTGPAPSFGSVDAGGGIAEPVVPGWNWNVANGARVSPDQTRVIYSRLTGQAPVQTLIRDLSTSEDVSFHATLEYPRWSADGNEIVGSWFVERRFPGDVAICPLAGPPCRLLAERARIPVHSVDESQVYFVRGFGTSQELFVIPVDGSDGERRLMTMAPLFPLGPFYDVTSDGMIVWVRHEVGRTELWLAEMTAD